MRTDSTVLRICCALMVAAATARQALAQAPAPQQAVLVTGASSGLGRSITQRLAERGYYVYAGARAQRDLDELDALPNVQAVRLDVTLQAEIDAAVAMIARAGRELRGVVNNAGVVSVAPLIEMEEKELDFIFDVNVYGAYRVTKAFAPLPPDAVADAVHDALSSERPRLRYLVVPAANQAAVVLRKIVEELVQLNEGHAYSYDRDALVKLLDDELARARARR